MPNLNLLTETKHVVLLGDSILDNAAYVAESLAVIDHLAQAMPDSWQATLLAADGATTSDVAQQTNRLPTKATHLVVSTGGNDALYQLGIVSEPAASISEALFRFSEIREDFRRVYRQMLDHVLRLELPVAVCTVYNSIPNLGPVAMTALAMFNEVILEEAFRAQVQVIDLRLICDEPADYSTMSPIEPSSAGGKKIAGAIVSILSSREFASGHSIVISRSGF